MIQEDQPQDCGSFATGGLRLIHRVYDKPDAPIHMEKATFGGFQGSSNYLRVVGSCWSLGVL